MSDTIEEKFRKEMRRIRKEMGLSQERAAEELGISCYWYRSIECGRASSGTYLTLRIIAFFGIDGKQLRSEINTEEKTTVKI